MKQKYTHYKRVRVMDYDSQQNKTQKYFRNEDNSVTDCGTKPADTFYLILSEQLEEQARNSPSHLLHWLSTGQGQRWVEMEGER